MATNLRVPYRIPAIEGHSSPAIWIYPPVPAAPTPAPALIDVEVGLTFGGRGFMTESTPPYNERWRITIDQSAPFYRYSSTYGNDDSVFPFLDYDGYRDGPFQTAAGWCIEQADLIEWQRTELAKLGFTASEIDDVNYTYARMLLERKYKEKYFLVYPQDTAIVDQSVRLDVTPRPDSVYRLWFYFLPTHEQRVLPVPKLAAVKRNGFTVVEMSYLTDREIPGAGQASTLPHGTRGFDGAGVPGVPAPGGVRAR